MIRWSDIDNEVEEFQSGYRAGFISIFKKYEGMETDERTTQNKVIVVNKSNFSERYGIAYSTFNGWLQKEVAGAATSSRVRPGPDQRALAQAAEEAAAKAKAEAEARAAKELSAALERQKREQALAEAKRAQEQAAKIRAEEQAKAAEATRKEREQAQKEMSELKAKLAEAAKAAKFDISTLSDADKAKVMTMLANDPDSAASYFEAQAKERERKAALVEKQRKEREHKRQQEKTDKEKVAAFERARKDYESSPLWYLVNKVMPVVDQFNSLLNQKVVNLDHLLISNKSAQEVIKLTEFADDTMEKMRESIYALNAEIELAGIGDE